MTEIRSFCNCPTWLCYVLLIRKKRSLASKYLLHLISCVSFHFDQVLIRLVSFLPKAWQICQALKSPKSPNFFLWWFKTHKSNNKRLFTNYSHFFLTFQNTFYWSIDVSVQFKVQINCAIFIFLRPTFLNSGSSREQNIPSLVLSAAAVDKRK